MITILFASIVSAGQCKFADADCNGKVSTDELLTYINEWVSVKGGETGIFEAVYLWTTIFPEVCYDSDGGKESLAKGTVSGVDVYGNPYEYTDTCSGGGVAEGYCFYGTAGSGRDCSGEGCVTWEQISCENGCQDGACII